MPNAISFNQARAMVRHYKRHHKAILQPVQKGKEILPLSEKFNGPAIDTLPAKPACAAIRIYYGMDTTLKVHALLVGVATDNKNILPVFAVAKSAGNNATAIIAPGGMRCPPVWPKDEGINSDG